VPVYTVERTCESRYFDIDIDMDIDIDIDIDTDDEPIIYPDQSLIITPGQSLHSTCSCLGMRRIGSPALTPREGSSAGSPLQVHRTFCLRLLCLSILGVVILMYAFWTQHAALYEVFVLPCLHEGNVLPCFVVVFVLPRPVLRRCLQRTTVPTWRRANNLPTVQCQTGNCSCLHHRTHLNQPGTVSWLTLHSWQVLLMAGMLSSANTSSASSVVKVVCGCLVSPCLV
jgi:hypothetical protein